MDRFLSRFGPYFCITIVTFLTTSTFLMLSQSFTAPTPAKLPRTTFLTNEAHADQSKNQAHHINPISYKRNLTGNNWRTNMEERIERLYQAAKVIVEELPDKQMYPRELLIHLKVLRTRQFSEETRPYRCNRCMAWKYKTTIEPSNVCRNQRSGQGLMILALVTTIPDEIEGRKAIRETWGSLSKNNTGYLNILFLYGSGWSGAEQAIIEKEDRQFGDVLQADFADNYYNLALKVLMGFRWAAENCPQMDFVLRTGTDNFINLPGLYLHLSQNKMRLQRGAIGRIFTKMQPWRIPDRKWFLSPRDIPDGTLPDYPIGTAFVFSLESVKELIAISPYVPFFPLEDQYFGYCMQAVAMPAINVFGFNFYILQEKWLALLKSGSQGKSLCPFKMPWYTVHDVDPMFMRHLWASCIDDKYKG